MSMILGQYGFVTIKDGAYKGDLGFYMQDVEPDADGYNRAHVALIEKSKVIITKFANLEWCPNQEELVKQHEASADEGEEPCPILLN